MFIENATFWSTTFHSLLAWFFNFFGKCLFKKSNLKKIQNDIRFVLFLCVIKLNQINQSINNEMKTVATVMSYSHLFKQCKQCWLTVKIVTKMTAFLKWVKKVCTKKIWYWVFGHTTLKQKHACFKICFHCLTMSIWSNVKCKFHDFFINWLVHQILGHCSNIGNMIIALLLRNIFF